MNKKFEIPIDELRSLVRYDAETGHLWWIGPKHKRDTLRPMGHLNYAGYRNVFIKGRKWRSHQVAWALHHGEWPAFQLDHINLVRSDNRICNLRPATFIQNLWNRGLRSDNKSGAKGVRREPRYGKWYAQITTNGKTVFIGSFDSFEEARDAYAEAAKTYHGDFARAA